MNITFTGTNSDFFRQGFFDSAGTLDSTDVTSPLGVPLPEAVVVNSETGFVVTATGSGLIANDDGPIGGTVNTLSFVQNGVVQGTFSGLSWPFTGLLQALLDIQDRNDSGRLAALLNSDGPIAVDARDAMVGYDFESFILPIKFGITQPITYFGSAFEDRIAGGRGDDLFTAGTGGIDFYDGGPGNDTVDLRGLAPSAFAYLQFADVAGPLTVDVDGATDSGTITFGDGVTTLLGAAHAIRDADGMTVGAGTGNDTLNGTGLDEGYLEFNGFQGADTYNLVVEGSVRISFSWGAGENPTQGLQVDLNTGVANDGFGFNDQINVLGGDGRLEIRGTRFADTMTGSDRRESFIGEGGNDTIDGGGGFDRLRFNRNEVSGVDVDLAAGTASGTWYGEFFTQTVLNIEQVEGSREGDDTIRGDGDGEYFNGRGGNDILEGRGGDDTFIGNDGDDTIDGGEGFDRAEFFWNRADATITVVAGGVQVTTPDGTDLLNFVEEIGFNDETLLTSDLLPAEPGIFDNGTPAPDTINGGSGNDTLNGRGSSDSIDGIAGDDILNGGFGFDTLVGGSGNDTLIGSNGFDSQLGGAGNDSLVGNFGNDTLSGGAGNDTLEGGLGFDRMVGDEGDDFLQARDGFDTLIGGAGNDTLEGNNGNDALDGGAGDDRLEGGLGADDMLGGADNDTLLGANGFDVLDGGAGDDLVQGNSGNDTVDGGAGNDTLQGGLGADTFIYSAGADRIADLQPIDSIEIEADLLTEANPVADDLRGYASLDAAGNLVLDFGGGNTLTFVGVGNTGAILDDVSFV